MTPPSFRPGGRGRPRAFSHTYSTYVDGEMDAAVRAYAKRSGVTIAAALRELLEYGLESVAESSVQEAA